MISQPAHGTDSHGQYVPGRLTLCGEQTGEGASPNRGASQLKKAIASHE